MSRAAAFDAVYRAQWDRMVGIASHALPRGEAEDVVARAFADAWARAEEMDADGLTRYVWKCVWNGCADTHRRGRHRVEGELNTRTQTLGAREFEQAEARLDIERAWRYLTAKQRDVLWLRHAEGLTYAEIGVLCGLAEGGAKSLAVRGRGRLWRRLTGTVRRR